MKIIHRFGLFEKLNIANIILLLNLRRVTF
jgi:hypothetical protein